MTSMQSVQCLIIALMQRVQTVVQTFAQKTAATMKWNALEEWIQTVAHILLHAFLLSPLPITQRFVQNIVMKTNYYALENETPTGTKPTQTSAFQ